jgi:hypothetical protein
VELAAIGKRLDAIERNIDGASVGQRRAALFRLTAVFAELADVAGHARDVTNDATAALSVVLARR